MKLFRNSLIIFCLNETTQFEKLGYVRIGMGMGKDNTIRDYVDLCLKTAAVSNQKFYFSASADTRNILCLLYALVYKDGK